MTLATVAYAGIRLVIRHEPAVPHSEIPTPAGELVLQIERGNGSVWFDNVHGTGEGASPSTEVLRRFAASRVVRVEFQPKSPDELRELTLFSNLSNLTLTNPPPLGTALGTLAKHPNLRQVTIMSATDLSGTDLRELRHLNQITSLSFIQCLIRKEELMQVLDATEVTDLRVTIPEWATDGDYQCRFRSDVEALLQVDYLVPERIRSVLTSVN